MAVLIDTLDRVLAKVGKRVVDRSDQAGTLTVQARSTVRAAACPGCQSWSNRCHGSYVRQLAERAVLDWPVVLSVEMQRFKCVKAGCGRRTFVENIDALAVGINVERARRPKPCRHSGMPSAGRRRPAWAPP